MSASRSVRFAMLRLLARCIIWLIIGAVITCAIALGASWRAPAEAVSTEPGAAAAWFARAEPEAMRQFEEVEWIEARGPARTVLLVGGWVHPRPGYREYLLHRAGWPWPALEATVELVDRRVQTITGGALLDDGRMRAINEGRSVAETQRVLPWRPVMPGFVLDAVVFGAIAWLLSFGPLVLRRAIRRRRGHCPRCGYDLRATAHNRCPECGARVRSEPLE